MSGPSLPEPCFPRPPTALGWRVDRLRRLRLDDHTGTASLAPPGRSILALAGLAAEALDCPYADIFVYEPDDGAIAMAFAGEPLADPVPFAWQSFCAAGPMIVPDATKDPATWGLPEVALFPAKRFFCGIPIPSSEGTVGTLVAFDFAPKPMPSRLSLAHAGLVAHAVSLSWLASRCADRNRPAYSGPIRI